MLKHYHWKTKVFNVKLNCINNNKRFLKFLMKIKIDDKLVYFFYKNKNNWIIWFLSKFYLFFENFFINIIVLKPKQVVYLEKIIVFGFIYFKELGKFNILTSEYVFVIIIVYNI